jgi:hypothetical protein
MPYVIADPETKPVTQTLLINTARVEVTAERTVDHVTIDQVVLNMPLNNPAGISIDVYWSIGYMDGPVLVPVEQGHAHLDAASAGNKLFEAMAAPATATSHYADFKGALYGLLQALHLIPAGAIF